MKTIKNYTAIGIAVLGLFTACQKNGAFKVVTGPAGTLQLERVDQDDKNYASINYNPDGTAANYTSLLNGAATIVSANYAADNKPAEVLYNNELYQLSYKNGQITRADIFNGKNSTDSQAYLLYTYNNNKIAIADAYFKIDEKFVRILQTKLQYNAAGDIAGFKSYTPDGANGDLKLSSAKTYTYDDKQNPYASIFNFNPVTPGIQPAHNLLKTVSYNKDNQVVKTETYAYTYHVNGYPTQVTTKTSKAGETDLIATSKFTYK